MIVIAALAGCSTWPGCVRRAVIGYPYQGAVVNVDLTPTDGDTGVTADLGVDTSDTESPSWDQPGSTWLSSLGHDDEEGDVDVALDRPCSAWLRVRWYPLDPTWEAEASFADGDVYGLPLRHFSRGHLSGSFNLEGVALGACGTVDLGVTYDFSEADPTPVIEECR